MIREFKIWFILDYNKPRWLFECDIGLNDQWRWLCFRQIRNENWKFIFSLYDGFENIYTDLKNDLNGCAQYILRMRLKSSFDLFRS